MLFLHVDVGIEIQCIYPTYTLTIRVHELVVWFSANVLLSIGAILSKCWEYVEMLTAQYHIACGCCDDAEAGWRLFTAAVEPLGAAWTVRRQPLRLGQAPGERRERPLRLGHPVHIGQNALIFLTGEV